LRSTSTADSNHPNKQTEKGRVFKEEGGRKEEEDEKDEEGDEEKEERLS